MNIIDCTPTCMLGDPLSEGPVLYLNPLHLRFADHADSALSGNVPLPSPRLQLIQSPRIHGNARVKNPHLTDVNSSDPQCITDLYDFPSK